MKESNDPKNILVSRTDKIGDLLLSIPVFQALREFFPQTRLTALVSPYAQEIVEGHPSVDGIETVDPSEGIFSLADRLRRLKPDVFLALYPRPKIVLAAWLAKIPVRIGSASRWYSLCLNRRVEIHRSLCEKHEAEYNLDMLRPLGVEKFPAKIQFPLRTEDRNFARDILEEKGIRPGMPYVVVHPGHKGSALNWRPSLYGHAVSQLCQRPGLRVVVTAGPDETALVSRVTAVLPPLPADQKPVLLIGECTLKQLAALYEKASCFLSGSTGTMHLAAAVGTPTVALFCPIPATTPVRWGPWGNRSTVIMPRNLRCPDCASGFCRKHDPMDAISVEEVLEAVENYLPRAGA